MQEGVKYNPYKSVIFYSSTGLDGSLGYMGTLWLSFWISNVLKTSGRVLSKLWTNVFPATFVQVIR